MQILSICCACFRKEGIAIVLFEEIRASTDRMSEYESYFLNVMHIKTNVTDNMINEVHERVNYNGQVKFTNSLKVYQKHLNLISLNFSQSEFESTSRTELDRAQSPVVHHILVNDTIDTIDHGVLLMKAFFKTVCYPEIHLKRLQQNIIVIDGIK